jgi:diamine N-acetyltransferase
MLCISEIPARQRRAAEVADILAACLFHPVEPDRLRAAVALYDQDDHWLFGASCGGQLVGVAGARVKEGEVEIRHLAVREDRRLQNVGRRLIRHVRARFPGSPLVLETDRDGRPFYEKCGFASTSLGEKYPGIERFRCVLSAADRETAVPRDDVTLEELPASELGQLRGLWCALNEHHRTMTTGWKGHFTRFTFDERCGTLTAPGKTLHVEAARRSSTRELIGYCISSAEAGSKGEIESLYVLPAARGAGVGKTLMRRSLDWLDALGIGDVAIGVAEGNEEALPFYEKLGFIPRMHILRRP